MYVSLLFWLGLLFPGYVVVRHLFQEDTRSGLLGTIAVSYVAVLGLLAPFSILCYVLRAPVWIFSATCWTAFLLALVEITRRRWWPELGRLVVAGLSIELVIVIVDMVLGGRAGSFFIGDALIHQARIRFLVDNGFSNFNPYVAVPYPFPTYHTNILHALYAACVQITGIDHFGVWFTSLVWGKLVVAAGAYYLAWTIFERQWAAWVAAVWTVAIQGPITFIVYPNKLAPFWLIPCMIAFAIQATRGECRWRSALKLAVGSLILGQVHGLYALFAALLLGPVLGAVALYRIIRKHSEQWRLAVCVLALAVGLPFPLISKLTTAATGDADAAATAKFMAKVDPDDTRFLQFDNGWVMKNPWRGFGGRRWPYVLLALGIAGALITPRRKQAAFMTAVVAVAVIVLFTPPVCTAVVSILGREWILGRFEFVLRLGVTALLPTAAVFWLERFIRPWWGRGLISLAVFFIAIGYSGRTGPYTWQTYREKAIKPAAKRYERMETLRQYGQFLKQVPRGDTVLVDLKTALSVVLAYDCHIVAAGSSCNGVADLGKRREDLSLMLAEDTPWERRRELLAEYDIHYFLPSKESFQWAATRIDQEWRAGNVLLWRLRID